MKKWRSVAYILAAALALGGTLGLSSCSKSKATTSKKQSYEYTTVAKGTIESTVASSGTLSVVSSVSVLAQMSGRIEKVDVDYNDRVTKGQVLATINTDLLKLQAKAAQASVDKAQANYDLQALAVQNAKALFDKGLLSEYDYKTAVSTLSVDKAELSSANASLEQIETEINQYAYITSPIDGIVLERDIDPGQSVVGGSTSSTSLFTLAANLEQMQIKAEVDELDISSIKKGQEVRFTVEADSGTTFTGKVKEVRLVPESSSNLVYYYVIILADNKSGKLLPGMTASVNFIKQKKSDILTVSSAALRFSPTTLSDAEKQKALFLASLPPDMSADQKTKAESDFDAMQKQQAAAKKSGTTSQSSGLTSLMSGGMGGGAGGPPGGFGGPGMNNQRRTTRTSSSSSTTGAAQGGSSQQAGQAAGAATGGAPSDMPPDMAQGGTNAASASGETVVRKPLWYLDDTGKLAAIMVEVGVSDSLKTEVSGAANLEGKKIILKVKAE
jgi:RND family efflux transporter, MFP subunit